MSFNLKTVYRNMPLAKRLRYSYFVILIPAILFAIMSIYMIQRTNTKYGELINAATAASQFSLDFKKDFDYETYLLIVENKTIEESELDSMLSEANRVVDELRSISETTENDNRLKAVEKYLKNLETYKNRIYANLQAGNLYEQNIEIWENDVQIVTALLREAILQYIYFEIQDMEAARESYESFYVKFISGSLVAFVLLTVIMIVMSVIIPAGITRPIKHLSEVSDQVAKGDLSVRAEVNAGAEVDVLSNSFNTMIDKVNDLLSQVTNEQIRLRKAELELLQAQINPHFLYNTLDTIVWLAESGEQQNVVHMVRSLSDFFRISLNQGHDIISIKEELQHVRSYLEIQQVRYQDIMEYEIDVPEALSDYRISKITLQPLVENALYHGIKNKRGGGKISIRGELFENYFNLSITDNGIGMATERLKSVVGSLNTKSLTDTDIYGMYNVNERIKLNFGEEYGLTVVSEYGKGTIVTIKLPLS